MTKATLQVNNPNSITTAICWCLAWGDKKQPEFPLSMLQQMRQALNEGKEVPEVTKSLVEQVKQLQSIPEGYFPKTLDELKNNYPELWNQKTCIGLVYGGATKIKQYVFEAAKIQDIRGASALLDRINLIDLPAFFNITYRPEENNLYQAQCNEIRQWLDKNFSEKYNHDEETHQYKLSDVLIPELIIYSTGGNILAFCPAAYINDLADAIEKRYTEETLTANSCAVGEKFRLLELQFGLLREPIENTLWFDWYCREYNKPIVQAYFGYPKNDAEKLEVFQSRKSFNELTTKLAILFNQRRSGQDVPNRPSRRYPPMFETHPYLIRDGGERRSAIIRVEELPRETYFSEASVRKYLVGDRAKEGFGKNPTWYEESKLDWQRNRIESWVYRFKLFLDKNPSLKQKYYENIHPNQVKISQSLNHIANASNGFIAYIYADGNNMGGYIQKEIKTPQEYQEFSEDVELATTHAVYHALAEKLHPHELRNFNDEEYNLRNGELLHPFEIITIGGDDILLIVPANQALQIAQIIGEMFEKILLKQVPLTEEQPANVNIKCIIGDYTLENCKHSDLKKYHRYKPTEAPVFQCQLSVSIGVLITASNTPIYYAQNLVEQLLKSAKERAKKLKKAKYYGGTVDFLTMKAVTMISSNIKDFRKQALTKNFRQKLKLYAAPYTFHELGGLLTAISALKKANFPKSQLYQIRSLLEQGKHTAILNYRYFRVRLNQGKSELQTEFEEAWCKPKDENNGGNLAPWMYDDGTLEYDKSDYPLFETIWREMVELYEFIEISETESSKLSPTGIE
ncbi:type III-B CRISPR-associated protein Cas10/Cmr2 [Westiellopsis prolifica IICB1]|nr:type III-B CRISPR-associated protein Cas10/Cmr2 [Westiellopsis prolifica IICB1]